MGRILRITMIALGLLACAQPAQAIWFRSESVEYQTDQADVVVIAVVREIEVNGKPSEVSGRALPGTWSMSEQVDYNCQVLESVKGTWRQDITFMKGIYYAAMPDAITPPEIAVGDRLLLFLRLDTRGIEARVINGLFLSPPLTQEQAHYPSELVPYNNQGEFLADEQAILRVVRSRQGRETRRGLIVGLPFQPRAEHRDYIQEFVITAEPEYKQQFIEGLQSENSDTRCDAIYNLISYPGEETEALLRGMLEDPARSTVELYGPTQTKISYYPVRQAAYQALTKLGVEMDPPSPYHPDVGGGIIASIGFEYIRSSPAPWTAEYDPSQSWGAWLAPLAFALGLPPLGLLLVWRRGRFSLRSLVLVVAIAAVLCGLCAKPVNIVLAGPNVKGELQMWLSGVGPAAGACFAGSLLLSAAVWVALLLWQRRARRLVPQGLTAAE